MLVDAHHHVWDPDGHAWLDNFPAIRRRFDLDEFAAVSAGVGASVLVQVLASTAETEDFLALAQGRVAGVVGVVGWADLTSPAIADELARLRELPGGDRLVGIRHLVQDEPDPGWLRGVRRGLRAVGAAGLRYDLLVRPAQLPAAVEVTGELAEVGFVLDHGGKPEIWSGELEPWSGLIAELASRPNVVCKFSGLVTEAGHEWTAERIAPYADWLLRCFGSERLMFGSDWPVCTLAASYAEVVALARDLLGAHLSATEMADVFGGNATRFYGLVSQHGV
ncbi:MAG TPA: amidohydrolase family protein [Streptosporangiaceae bacterium]|nr:amidohydrolase family protein [Streptosporangiaceae bacterium]